MRYPLVPGPRPPGAARGASYGDARPERRRDPCASSAALRSSWSMSKRSFS